MGSVTGVAELVEDAERDDGVGIEADGRSSGGDEMDSRREDVDRGSDSDGI